MSQSFNLLNYSLAEKLIILGHYYLSALFQYLLVRQFGAKRLRDGGVPNLLAAPGQGRDHLPDQAWGGENLSGSSSSHRPGRVAVSSAIDIASSALTHHIQNIVIFEINLFYVAMLDCW